MKNANAVIHETNENYTGTAASRQTIRAIAVSGILSALAFILMLIEFPVPLMPSFIKFDFSDFPALLGAFALGPVYGILIEFVKNLIHCLFSGSFAVGELSNFMLGAVFTAVAGTIYRRMKTKRGAILGAVIGAVAMAVFSLPSNLFIVYPVYYNFMPEATILAAYQAIFPGVNSILEALLLFNLPFTFIKGMLDVLITFLLYKNISPLLHGRS